MKQPYNTTIYNTALYMRLSRDDELQGESGSIQTQRMMLRQYAAEHGLNVIDEYIDDGWSGTNFDRPDFQRMIDDIEDGKINCVVTKDLSRLGRNYILTGQYTEIYFPSKGVRYIAVNDNVDTINGENELAPFLNILNEMHARQTSKKVKAAMRTRFANGAHYGAYAPLGYVKDPDKKGHLLIDPETRWIIEKIFDLAVHGRGAASITRILVEEKVPTPGWLNFQRYGTFANIYAGAPEEKAYAWTIAQVKSILKEETYIGHSVHNKQTNISFKNKKKVRKPKEEWYRVENTHEAIISEDVFRQVQEQICNRRRRQKNGTTQIFSGLVKCADCGWSLAYGMNSQNKNPYAHYHCSKYGQGLHQCSMHYIRYDVLYAYVLSRLQYWSVLAQQDGDKLLKRLLNASDKERNTARKRQTAELKKAEKRKAEVDTLFAKMYEDWSAGRITEYNFNMLSEKYQGEQRELDVKIERLHEAMEAAAQTAVDAEKWIGLMKQYVNPTELTAELLNTLIEKIIIHEPKKDESGEKVDRTTTDAQTTNNTSVMMTTVSGDMYAIGYISLGSLNNTVKAVKIDGVEPTVDNVKNETYKIARPFNIAYKEDALSDAAKDFINYIMSSEGQQIITDNGYISIDGAQPYSGNNTGGKIVIAGSSSVSPVMEKLAEAYKKINADADIEIQTNDSTTGMTSAADGVCDIGMASRELKDNELESGLTPLVIAMDGIAVIVNNDNPASDISSDEIKSIYIGEIGNWESIIK